MRDTRLLETKVEEELEDNHPPYPETEAGPDTAAGQCLVTRAKVPGHQGKEAEAAEDHHCQVYHQDGPRPPLSPTDHPGTATTG